MFHAHLVFPQESGGAVTARRIFLNVGCGPRNITIPPSVFPAADWREVRLDIDPAAAPDIVASITDMAPVADGTMDALWSSHNLEHLDPHEVPKALREFLRVLKPGGRLLLAVPDLQAVAQRVAEDRFDDPLYLSNAGPILPLDVIYGYGAAIAAGNRFMAHRTGFTARMLGQTQQEVGFAPVAVRRDERGFELQVLAFRPPVPAEVLESLGFPPSSAD